MDSQWLSLNEYSGKYHISISTLRRRIRAGQIPFSLKFGKYFLRDKSPVGLRQLKKGEGIFDSKDRVGLEQSVLKQQNPLTESLPLKEGQRRQEGFRQQDVGKKGKAFEKESKEINTSSFLVKSLQDSLLQEKGFFNKLIDSQKELCERLEQKEKRISEQQNKIGELNTLVALLEKENKELKSLLYQEKEVEEWLEMNGG